MDIVQLDKVLQAQNLNQKHRRGKQETHVNVYQNASLKESEQNSENSSSSIAKQPLASPDQEKTTHSHLLPPMVIGNSSIGPILVSVAESLERVSESLEDLTKNNKNPELPLKSSESSNIIEKPRKYKRQAMNDYSYHNTYTLRSKIQQEDNPGGNDEFEIEIDSSQRQVSGEHLAIERFSDKAGIHTETNTFQTVNGHRTATSEKLCLDAQLTNNSYKDAHSVRYVKDYRKEKDLEDTTYLSPSKDFPRSKGEASEFSANQESNSGIVIDMSQFCMEQQLKSEIEVMDIPIPDEYPEPNEPSMTENAKRRSGPTHTDDVVSSSTQTDNKYQTVENAATRVSIGQQWLDANLKDAPGARTFAKDIEWAYTQDHPEEPISESNMAMLIKGKFPGRRKQVIQNNNAVFIYNDLKLVKKCNVNNTPQVPIMSANPINTQTQRCKPYNGIYPSPQAVIVTQPNVNTVVCSPPANSIFNYQGFPCVALQVMPPMTSPPYEPFGLPNMKQNMNLRPSPVSVNQPLNISPNMPYILPNSTPAMQQLNFTPVQVQTLSPSAVHPMRVPLALEDSALHPAMSPMKVPPVARQNPQSFPSFHPQKMTHSQGHSTIPVRRNKTSIPPLKGPHISTAKKQQLKDTASQGNTTTPQKMPVTNTRNSDDGYYPDVLKNKSVLPIGELSPVAKISPNTSISPLMKVIKEEPISSEENLYFIEQLKASIPRSGIQNNNCSSEKIKKMAETVLPDMDVDDYISNEISDSNKINRHNSPHHQKSLDATNTITTFNGPSDYNSPQKNGFFSWMTKRKDADASPNVMTIPKQSQVQSSFHSPEVITVLDGNISNDSPVHQERYLNQTLLNQNMNKRARKVWDEDIRKSVSTEKADAKQNSKYKRRHSPKKRGLFSDFKEQDTQVTDYNNRYVRDPIMPYTLQRDGQEAKMPETLTSARSPYSRRVRDVPSKKNNEPRNMHAGASSLQNIQDFSRTGDSLPKLQLMTSRINMSQASPTSEVKTHYTTNWSNSHKGYKPLSPDPCQKQAVNSVLQTARHLLKDIGPPLSETEIACRLEAALYEENPAAVYTSEQPLSHCSNDSNPEAFPCSVTQTLKELTRSIPDSVNQLLLHQESCHGLGCSEKCKTLKAAYTHIFIFRHRCSVWNTYVKVFSKHSRACRRVRCTLPLCLFMKHELHLNGVSVLPMQYPEERDLLENHFRRCEKTGPHNAELRCRHLQGTDSTTASDTNMTSVSEESKGLSGTSFIKEIRTLVDEAHQNNNTSKSVLRMLEVLTDMMRLHVYKSNIPKHGEKYIESQ